MNVEEIESEIILKFLKTLRDTFTWYAQTSPSGSARKVLTRRQNHLIQRFSFLVVQPRQSTISSILEVLEDEEGNIEAPETLTVSPGQKTPWKKTSKSPRRKLFAQQPQQGVQT